MIKKNQIIAIILIFPIITFSQKRFSFGINANSHISILSIKKNQVVNETEEKGKREFGYMLGFQTQYDLSEKVILRSGLNFQNRKIHHRIEGLRFGSDIRDNTESSIQNKISIKSIGIPLDLGFLIKSKKNKINYLIGFGGIMNLNLDTKTEAKTLHELVDDEDLPQAKNEVKSSTYTIGAFGGIEVPLSAKLLLGIEPNLKFNPKKITLFLYESEASIIEPGITLRIRMN